MLNSKLFSTLLGRPLIANPNVAAVYDGMERSNDETYLYCVPRLDSPKNVGENWSTVVSSVAWNHQMWSSHRYMIRKQNPSSNVKHLNLSILRTKSSIQLPVSPKSSKKVLHV